MPAIAVIYATTEGHTRKIAKAIADRFDSLGWSVNLLDAADKPSAEILTHADAAILAGSLHVHVFQNALAHFAKHNAERLNAMPTAFCAVSLSALGEPEEKDGAGECVEKFLAKTGWRPAVTQHVAGALMFTKYDFFKTWIMKRIAKDHGMDVSTGEDIEYTDWDALNVFCDEFAARAKQAA